MTWPGIRPGCTVPAPGNGPGDKFSTLFFALADASGAIAGAGTFELSWGKAMAGDGWGREGASGSDFEQALTIRQAKAMRPVAVVWGNLEIMVQRRLDEQASRIKHSRQTVSAAVASGPHVCRCRQKA